MSLYLLMFSLSYSMFELPSLYAVILMKHFVNVPTNFRQKFNILRCYVIILMYQVSILKKNVDGYLVAVTDFHLCALCFWWIYSIKAIYD